MERAMSDDPELLSDADRAKGPRVGIVILCVIIALFVLGLLASLSDPHGDAEGAREMCDAARTLIPFGILTESGIEAFSRHFPLPECSDPQTTSCVAAVQRIVSECRISGN